MTVLDAYCLIALLRDEPAAGEVEALLHAESAAISAINLAESLDVLQRRDGIGESELHRELSLLPGDALEVRPVTTGHAWRAAELRTRYYDRRERDLSLADCILLASAGPGERIATADPAVVEVARAEGLDVLALPGRDGARR